MRPGFHDLPVATRTGTGEIAEPREWRDSIIVPPKNIDGPEIGLLTLRRIADGARYAKRHSSENQDLLIWKR